MELRDQTDHVALLSLMISGVLIKRLIATNMLDDDTADHIQRLVQGVRIHARNAGLEDLNVLFDNIGHAISERKVAA